MSQIMILEEMRTTTANATDHICDRYSGKTIGFVINQLIQIISIFCF